MNDTMKELIYNALEKEWSEYLSNYLGDEIKIKEEQIRDLLEISRLKIKEYKKLNNKVCDEYLKQLKIEKRHS